MSLTLVASPLRASLVAPHIILDHALLRKVAHLALREERQVWFFKFNIDCWKFYQEIVINIDMASSNLLCRGSGAGWIRVWVSRESDKPIRVPTPCVPYLRARVNANLQLWELI